MRKKPILVGALIAGAFVSTTNANSNYAELGSGNEVRENLMTVKGADALDKFSANLTCGEGRCGESTTTKSAEHKCGEDAKKASDKSTEHKCDESTKKADAKSNDKSVEHKCGEGKCGEASCGEKTGSKKESKKATK